MKTVFPCLFLFFFMFWTQTCLAWGGRGHHAICEAATFLVKNENLRVFLTARPQVMGHLCNIPDIYWKSQGDAQNAIGSPTHYFKPELLKDESVSFDYKVLLKNRSPKDLGSLWWRADQFYRRALLAATSLKSAKPPQNKQQDQDEKLPYNQMTFEFYVNLGIMGHFLGDASMPYHSSVNYDGYDSGHGGIHAYYEDLGVDAQDVDLTVSIREEGEKLQKQKTLPKFLSLGTVLEMMQALTTVCSIEVSNIENMDPVLKKSTSGENKTPADRKPIHEVAGVFRPLMQKEMGRSAATLARIWDKAYEAIGKPDLSGYRSYRYPFQPDFVPPDYY